MKFVKIPYHIVKLFLCCLSFNYSIAQKKDYKLDSLQIKVYTEIDYVNSQSKEIRIKYIFCDYCSDNQLKFIEERAKELAFFDRYNQKKRIENGKRKFAIIIRISKKDFLAMKTDIDKK